MARRSQKLARASAYFRLAAKADGARQYKQGASYRDIANHLVASARRDREYSAQIKAAQAARRAS